MTAYRTTNRLTQLDDVTGSPLTSQVLTWNGSAWTPADGAVASRYTHHQSVASATWIITHNLGRYPSVAVVDSADAVVQGDITFDSTNQLTLTFGAAFAGTAYLN